MRPAARTTSMGAVHGAASSRGAARLVASRQGRAARPVASWRGGVVAMVYSGARGAVDYGGGADTAPFPSQPPLLARTSGGRRIHAFPDCFGPRLSSLTRRMLSSCRRALAALLGAPSYVSARLLYSISLIICRTLSNQHSMPSMRTN